MRRGTTLSAIATALLALAAAYFGIDLSGDQFTQQTKPKIDRPADGVTVQETKPDRKPARKPAAFDHYILSLSWSPTWCGENDPSGNTAQCDSDNDYGFIVHGLWPEKAGTELAFCPTRQPDRVPDSLIRQYFDIIPSAGLAGHEWRKHGTCSGLDQKDYFRTLKAAFQKVTIPASVKNVGRQLALPASDIEKKLLSANPGMRADGVILTCEGGELAEIRICLDQDLGFTACPAMESRACRAKSVSIPPIL